MRVGRDLWRSFSPTASLENVKFSLDVWLLKFGPTFAERFVNVNPDFSLCNKLPTQNHLFLDWLQTLLTGFSSMGVVLSMGLLFILLFSSLDLCLDSGWVSLQ